MKIEKLERNEELKSIQTVALIAVVGYWPWYFILQNVSQQLHDDFLGRIAISFLAGLLYIYSKNSRYQHSHLRLYFNAGLALVIVEYAMLLSDNQWSSTYQYAYLVTSIIVASAVHRLKDFVWISLFAVMAPAILALIHPPNSQEGFLFFTAANATIYLFIGNKMRTSFKFRAEAIQLIKTTSKNSKLASLGQMAAGMAHEINNPLAIIKGKADQILMRTISDGPVDRENLRSELAKISATAERIAKIIRGLKTFSRNSEQDPFAPLELKTWIQNTLEFCQQRLTVHQIELAITAIPELSIEGRESQLVQVLLNLLNNSVDALEKSTIKKIEIKFEFSQSRLKVLVLDSGVGISKDAQLKLAEPFFTTKEPGKGTGLGLSISRGIMEAHHGSLNFDPTQGMTCFCIEIEARPTTSDALPQAA